MNRVERIFAPVLGKPCWGVSHGYAGVLTFEFGPPHLVIHEPLKPSPTTSRKIQRALARRMVFVHGRWHLSTWACNWVVRKGLKKIGSSKRSSSAGRVLEFLDGQKLSSLSIAPKGGKTIFRFDLGGELETIPHELSSEVWHLQFPGDRFLRFFGNRTYDYAHGSVQDPKRHTLKL